MIHILTVQIEAHFYYKITRMLMKSKMKRSRFEITTRETNLLI